MNNFIDINQIKILAESETKDERKCFFEHDNNKKKGKITHKWNL